MPDRQSDLRGCGLWPAHDLGYAGEPITDYAPAAVVICVLCVRWRLTRCLMTGDSVQSLVFQELARPGITRPSPYLQFLWLHGAIRFLFAEDHGRGRSFRNHRGREISPRISRAPRDRSGDHAAALET